MRRSSRLGINELKKVELYFKNVCGMCVFTVYPEVDLKLDEFHVGMRTGQRRADKDCILKIMLFTFLLLF
jgi:hypothetical protein